MLKQNHTVTFNPARSLRSLVGKPGLSAENTHIDPGSSFFILEIALIASNRAPQSRFITGVLTLPESHHPASLAHRPLDQQKCFHSAPEHSIMRKHDNGEVAHSSSRCTSTRQNNRSNSCSEVAHFDIVSLVLCRGVMHFLGVVRVLVEHMCVRQAVLTVTHFPACSPVVSDRPAVSWKSE